jgi:hypothetical protein
LESDSKLLIEGDDYQEIIPETQEQSIQEIPEIPSAEIPSAEN